MEIILEGGQIDFVKLLPLIRIEWPEEFGDPTDENIIAEMQKSYNKENDVIKYLLEDGKLIGWYRYTSMKEDDGSDLAHSLDIAVLPEYHGQGLGKLLMKDMILSSKEDGNIKLMSRTMESNVQSIRLHKSMGFREAFRKGTSVVWEILL